MKNEEYKNTEFDIKELDMLNKLSEISPKIKLIISTVNSVKEYLLKRKIKYFLKNIEKIDKKKRDKFIFSFSQKKVETLFLMIEKHEDFQRSELLGKIFKSRIEEDINENEFWLLAYSINNLNLALISKLKIFYLGKNATMSESEKMHLVNLLLIDFDSSKVGTWGGGSPGYNKSDLGKKFITILSSNY